MYHTFTNLPHLLRSSPSPFPLLYPNNFIDYIFVQPLNKTIFSIKMIYFIFYKHYVQLFIYKYYNVYNKLTLILLSIHLYLQ